MPYRIEIKRSAGKELERLPLTARRDVAAAIDALAQHPRGQGSQKLSAHENHYRVRAGNYRIVYTIRDDVLTVIVIAIGHRKDVYRGK